MKALIITEGGRNVGFGHITRCVALSQGFKSKGIDVSFIVNGDESVINYLLKEQYKIFNWIKEKDRLLVEVKKNNIIVIDSYLADKELYEEISGIADDQLLIIDDYKRINYPIGVVVNPSINSERFNYPQKNGVTYLLGKDYIILRKEFQNVSNKIINEKVKNILVTFGGISHDNFMKKFLNFLSNNYSDFNYHIIANMDFNFNVKLKFNLYSNLSAVEMRDLMMKVDVCVSAGGQTIYELARVGVPTVGICMADNQKFNLIGLKEERVIEYPGKLNSRMFEWIGKRLSTLLDCEKRCELSHAARSLIDGKGTERIVYKLMNPMN
ncbi:MAG: UDP-2,4-diacetamido-2,4,6-trideoxy-beta-L-altropyranose hydrolase [Candidatus Omnitrophica bacterium]|nr:UDP-2,4-diacetamido-2,4,6-trideoxy-beta-L-altropyranose hydrolase [Candidatus Omnitrophota bacterium]MCK5491948.1 UDP-2,4-diacetamido-2,4,6-trideoxy-beta-L-altropyranose hydrolase [Candidatus Omnitrophota bacterium]